MTDFEYFIETLQQAFGIRDEQREAEFAIKKLKQTGSASSYNAKYLQLLAKTGWDPVYAMSNYFDGLKEKVQEELYKEDRPESIHEYMTMATRIDNRQYQWRTRKQTKDSGKSTYYANTGKTRQQRSAVHGTHSGPMELGAVEKRQCYNCGEYGHISPNCDKPKRDRKWKPVKEGKNPRNHQGKTFGMIDKIPELSPRRMELPVRGRTTQQGQEEPKTIAKRNEAESERIFQELQERFDTHNRILPYGPLTREEQIFCVEKGILKYTTENARRYAHAKDALFELYDEVNTYYKNEMKKQNPRNGKIVIYGRTYQQVLKNKRERCQFPRFFEKEWNGTNHSQIAWMSCFDHDCDLHRKEKVQYDTFPCQNGEVPHVYTREQVRHITVKLGEIEGYTMMKTDKRQYPIECLNNEQSWDKCEDPRCQIHKEDKLFFYHQQKDLQDIALSNCDYDISKCDDWNCQHHLHTKKIAFEEARWHEDDNPVQQTIKEFADYEASLRDSADQRQKDEADYDEQLHALKQQILEKDEEIKADQTKNDINHL
jgi:hypothetical protein